MGLVDDQLRVVAFRERRKFSREGAIAIHAEDAFDGDEFVACGRRFLQRVFEKGEIEVREDDFARAGKPDAVDYAGVVRGVGEDDVLRAGDASWTGAHIRRVARVEITAPRVRARELRQLGLELLPNFGVAGEQARPGGTDGAAFGERFDNGGGEARIVARSRQSLDERLWPQDGEASVSGHSASPANSESRRRSKAEAG